MYFVMYVVGLYLFTLFPGPQDALFSPKNVTKIRPASYALRVSISKLTNTRTRIEWKRPWRWF